MSRDQSGKKQPSMRVCGGKAPPSGGTQRNLHVQVTERKPQWREHKVCGKCVEIHLQTAQLYGKRIIQEQERQQSDDLGSSWHGPGDK